MAHRPGVLMRRTGQDVDAAQAGGIDAARRPGALTRGAVRGGCSTEVSQNN